MRTIDLKAMQAAQGQPLPQTSNITPLDQILLLRDVKAITKLSTPTLYRHMNSGMFPRSVRISRGRVGWRASDINRWMRGLSQPPKAA